MLTLWKWTVAERRLRLHLASEENLDTLRVHDGGAAVVPLLAYGAVSIVSVRGGAQQAVIKGNQDVARRVGEQIEAYVTGNVRILNAVAADMQRTATARSGSRTKSSRTSPASSPSSRN